MKKYNIYISIIALASLVFSCTEPDDLVTADAVAGGRVEVTSASNSYVVGNSGPYSMEFFVHQNADVQVDSIQVYKSFSGTYVVTGSDGEDSVVSYSSNEILDRGIEITEPGKHFFTTSYMYDEMIEGLEANGEALPTEDGGLRIGDKFDFKIVTHLSDGREVVQAYTVSYTVSTRYAGTYTAIEAAYVNNPYNAANGFPQGHILYTAADWPVHIIESVDATTYRVLEYIGVFDGNEWYFQIVDGVISYPAETPDGDTQLLNGQPIITCESNPADMTDVHCGDTNYVINNDATGEDILVMSLGYYTASGGTPGARQFYQRLQKVVE